MANASDTAPIALTGTQKIFSAISKSSGWLEALGFSWLLPILRMVAGASPREQMAELRQVLLFPVLGISAFVLAWAVLAPKVQTSLGAVPGPVQVFEQGGVLWADHVREREKAATFYALQDEKNAVLIAEGKDPKFRNFTGKPTYIDQIVTSLFTVGLGFVIATLVAVPLGIDE